MKIGENAGFTIPLEPVCGESGSLPTISPNATLQFYFELLSWTSVEDNCKDGGYLIRYLLREENGRIQRTSMKCQNAVFYEAKLEDGTVVSKVDVVEFTVKEELLRQ